MNRPSLSIGIEEEYQTIDPHTRDLRSHIQSEILPKAKLATMDRAKPELHQAVVEVGTKVCRDIQEAREDILDLRRQMITLIMPLSPNVSLRRTCNVKQSEARSTSSISASA